MSRLITDRQSALEWATMRCARRESCRKEITQKLRDTPLAPTAIAEILDALESEGYIDHARYAQAFVHDKLAYDRWGRLKIEQALRLKGIERDHISAAFESELIDEDYRDTLLDLLRAKVRTLRFDPTDRKATYLATQKLLRFAASRGYEADLIFDCIDQLSLHE